MNRHQQTAVAFALAMFALLVCHSANVVAKEKSVDRYQAPKDDVAALVKFIENLQKYQPTTTAEILAYRQKAVAAFQTAANRILEFEADETSEAYRLAGAIKFQLQLNEVAAASESEQREFYDELAKYILAAKETTTRDVALANTFCQVIEEAKNVELAEEAYAAFGNRFVKLDDEKLADYGQRMVGVSRRLGLPGSKMHLAGTTVTGEEFDWKSYRGKVVLVDFWATWCRPCLEELPNLKEYYQQYHDKGFDVVGVSLDDNRNRLRRFLAEEEVPWACLFEDGTGWNHPMVRYYGIDATPTTILVNRAGKVVAINAHGGALGRELSKLLGPTDEVKPGQ